MSVTVSVPVLPWAIESVAGCRLVRVGAGITVKLAALVAVPARVCTVREPVVAVGGTTAISVVGLVTVNVDETPLNVTVCTLTKLAPVTVTDVPGWPLVGVKPVMVGTAGLTVTWLAALPPLSIAVMVVEPAATAVTEIGTLDCPAMTAMAVGTGATATLALLTARVPAAVGVGASAAETVPLAPARRFSGFGARKVG